MLQYYTVCTITRENYHLHLPWGVTVFTGVCFTRLQSNKKFSLSCDTGFFTLNHLLPPFICLLCSDAVRSMTKFTDNEAYAKLMWHALIINWKSESYNFFNLAFGRCNFVLMSLTRRIFKVNNKKYPHMQF